MKEKAKFYYALFSESGFDKKIVAVAEKDNDTKLYDLSKIVNLNDLYKQERLQYYYFK